MIFLRQPGYEPAGCRTYYPQKQKPRHSRAIRLTPRKGRAFYTGLQQNPEHFRRFIRLDSDAPAC